MGRKINYFDDDYDEQVKRSEKLNDIIRNKRLEIKQSAQVNRNVDFRKKLKGVVVSGEKNAMAFAHDVAHHVQEKDNKHGLRFLILLIATVIILAVMVGSVAISFHHQNSKNKLFNLNAGEVCTEYITDYGNCSYENLYDNYGVVGYRMTGLCFARQMNFDGDGNDELLLCYNDGGEYFVEVWGYNKDKKFVSLYHANAAQSKDTAKDAWITIYYKNNKYYIGTHNKKDITKVDLYQLKGDTFEKKKSCTYDEQLEAFVVKDKIQYDSFERVKLAVLNEKKAIVTVNLVTDVLDDFTTENGVSEQVNTGKSINTAYKEVVQGLIQTHGEPKIKSENGYSYIDGVACVKQIDFNGDGTNELLVSYRKPVRVREINNSGDYIATTRDTYYCEVYKYNGKNAVMVYQKDSVSNLLNDKNASYIVLKKGTSKTYLCTNSFKTENYGRIVNAKSNIMRFDGERFVSRQKSSYYTEYGYTHYYIDDKSVYRSTFNEKGYEVPFFDGEESYDAGMFDIFYLQQKDDDKDRIEAQLSQVKTEINKLK